MENGICKMNVSTLQKAARSGLATVDISSETVYIAIISYEKELT